MDAQIELAEHFARSRSRLHAAALRMLGAADLADDAVQEAWLRASRAGAEGIVSPTAWLTTIVGRVCLEMLRARRRRREDPGAVPDTSMALPAEEVALHLESVGLALLVVLDTLGPAERVAFVLHDLFEVPFDEIGAMLNRTPAAAKKLASRARRRVHEAPRSAPPDLARERRVIEAFLAAARAGDIDALLQVLAPEVVRRADAGALHGDAPVELRGARAVAEETATNGARARFASVLLVDGRPAIVVAPAGKLRIVIRAAIEGEQITRLEVSSESAELRELRLSVCP